MCDSVYTKRFYAQSDTKLVKVNRILSCFSVWRV